MITWEMKDTDINKKKVTSHMSCWNLCSYYEDIYVRADTVSSILQTVRT